MGCRFFRPQGFGVIARLLMLWMIGGSRKSANKKTEKIHLSVKCHLGVEVRMLCEKNEKRDSDTERRIYDSVDILLAFLITVADPLHSFRMTPYQFSSPQV